MHIVLSPNVPSPNRMAFLVEAGPGSVVTVTTEHGLRVWTKQDNRDWSRELDGSQWETHQLADVLFRLGGDQTLETFGDFDGQSLTADEIAGLRRKYSEDVRATRTQELVWQTSQPR